MAECDIQRYREELFTQVITPQLIMTWNSWLSNKTLAARWNERVYDVRLVPGAT